MAVITEQMIQSAIDRACDTMSKGEGGPFGALILTPDGQVFVSSNQVLKDHDPTAHAEVTCIRKACSALKSHDLSGCVLYTTCMPCPMCLSAVIWANIKEVYYGCTAKDAESIGFRDDFIYRYIQGRCSDNATLELKPLQRDRALKLLEDYKKQNGKIY